MKRFHAWLKSIFQKVTISSFVFVSSVLLTSLVIQGCMGPSSDPIESIITSQSPIIPCLSEENPMRLPDSSTHRRGEWGEKCMDENAKCATENYEGHVVSGNCRTVLQTQSGGIDYMQCVCRIPSN